MKNAVRKIKLKWIALLPVVGMMSVGTEKCLAELVAKVADLQAAANGVGIGPGTPRGRFTQYGTNLLFTPSGGGAYGFGGVFLFNPVDALNGSPFQMLASLNATTGTVPYGGMLIASNGIGYFTASATGAQNKGTLCSYDLTNNIITSLYAFPTNNSAGTLPHSTPVQIGGDLWLTCSSGGSNSYGAINRYNIASSNMTAYLLDGTNLGRGPQSGTFVQAGNAWYLLTFFGGTNITATGLVNGGGTIDRLSFDTNGNPSIVKLVDLPPPGSGLSNSYCGLPACNPAYDGTNFLYFTCVGTTANPGAIARYDIASNVVTTLWTFSSNAVAAASYGKQPYNSPVLLSNVLYFTTFSGGTAGKGIVGKLTLSNNVVTKLADLDGTTNLVLGSSPQYAEGTIYTNPVSGHASVYFNINSGGAYNNGTILRVNTADITVSIANSPAGPQISWSGGIAPYGVDSRPDLATDWYNLTNGLSTNSIVVPPDGDQSFFRVFGLSQ